MNQPSTLPQVSYAGATPAWPDGVYYGLSGRAWARIGVIALLMVGLFWPILLETLRKTNPFREHQNWGHAVFVPLIGLYYLYLNREALLAASAEPATLQRRHGRVRIWPALAGWVLLQAAVYGLVFVAFAYFRIWFHYNSGLAAAGLVFFSLVTGLLAISSDWGRGVFSALAGRSATWFGIYMLVWGIWFYSFGIAPGRNHFFQGFAVIFTLFGVVLLQCGWHVMRIAWFPIAFLACALPWPELVYTSVAVPLQFLASEAATFTLRLTGVDAFREGTTLFIGDQQLNVAEACAGIKSLMTFVTVAAAVGFLSNRPMWQKITVAASGVPIAIFCNMIRVAGQGLLHKYVSPKLSEGFAHMFVGMVMLIPAFFLIMGVAWLIDSLFIEEDDGEAAATATAAAAAKNETVIEVRRPKAKTAAPAASPQGQADLAAATQRMMRASVKRSSPGEEQ